jgi:cytochrome c peroxidase
VELRPTDTFVKAYMHNGYFKTLSGLVHFYNTRDLEHATAILVTHQIRDGFYIATHDSRMDEWNDIPQGLGVAVKDVDASATLRDSQVGDRQGGGASKS